MGTILGSLLGMNRAPTDEDMKKMIDECDALVGELGSRVKFAEQLSADLEKVKKDYGEIKTAKIQMNGDAIDQQVWNSKSDEQKTTAYEEIHSVVDRLGNLNKSDLRQGKMLFTVISSILVLSVVLYFFMHWEGRRDSTAGGATRSVPTREVIEIQKHLVQLQAFAKLDQKQDSVKSLVRTSFNALKTIVLSRSNILSPDVAELVGKLEGQIELQTLPQETLDSMGRMLSAQIKSLNARFFWNADSRKWLEIMFWSVWGTIVGILFYLAGKLSGEIFDRHEIPEIAAEIIITPLVVVTIFFLFDFAGITAVVPQESSIYITLGFAFILGFAIRRTVGLLDTIKKRILPEPSSA